MSSLCASWSGVPLLSIGWGRALEHESSTAVTPSLSMDGDPVLTLGTYQPGATGSRSRKELVAVQSDSDSPGLTVLNGSG